jgi:hypothetical protein
MAPGVKKPKDRPSMSPNPSKKPRRRRVCGKICHNARRNKCGCWCGGLFHGKQGELARAAFAAEWGSDPKGDHGGIDSTTWTRAITAARATPRVSHDPILPGVFK